MPITKSLTYKGVTKSYKSWARIYHLRPETLSERIRNGWSVEKALTKTFNKYEERNKSVERVDHIDMLRNFTYDLSNEIGY